MADRAGLIMTAAGVIKEYARAWPRDPHQPVVLWQPFGSAAMFSPDDLATMLDGVDFIEHIETVDTLLLEDGEHTPFSGLKITCRSAAERGVCP